MRSRERSHHHSVAVWVGQQVPTWEPQLVPQEIPLGSCVRVAPLNSGFSVSTKQPYVGGRCPLGLSRLERSQRLASQRHGTGWLSVRGSSSWRLGAEAGDH